MTEHLFPELPILMIDDEQHILNGMMLTLAEAGINHVESELDSRNVSARVSSRAYEIILLDLTMPHISGLEVLQQINADHPEIPVIIVTGINTIESAVDAIRAGAYDYLVKPVEVNRMISIIKRAIEVRELRRENERLRNGLFSKAIKNPDIFSEIVTVNDKMHTIFRYMEAIAKTSEPVLITGETGTGKELIAKAFHRLSGRAGQFVTVNAAGLDDHMFTDTLFGHKKGAFTDAQNARSGLIEKASGGILFLDEIGDLSLASQVKLLRLLQENEFYPLGSDDAHYSDALIIVATNQDLKKMLEKGEFRKDLYYRLHAHHIHLPPLRERTDDIPVLAELFFEEAAQMLGKKKPAVQNGIYSALGMYMFPGNVRELRAMIIDAVSVHEGGAFSENSFRALKKGDSPQQEENCDDLMALFLGVPFFPTLKDVQQCLIHAALAKTHNNQSVASQLLGITRQALSQRLKSGKDDEETS